MCLRKVIIILVSVAVLAGVFFQPSCSRSVVTLPVSSSTTDPGRVFLVGLDGASWVVLHPMMKMGQVPVLHYLTERGARSRCQTIIPTLSPIIWTSIATGRSAGDHGILHFTRLRPRTNEQENFSAIDRRVPALWEIMTKAGRPGIYINWLMSWPVDDVRGVMVGDRWDVERSHLAFPEEWNEYIRSLLQGSRAGNQLKPASLPQGQADNKTLPRKDFNVNRMSNMQAAMQMVEFNPLKDDIQLIGDLFCRAFVEVNPHVGMLYFNNLDPASHRNWAGIEQRSDQAIDVTIGSKSRHIMQIYRDVDAVLGRVCALIEEPMSIIIVSDHGMESRDVKPRHYTIRDINLDALLYRLGLLDLDEAGAIRWDTSRVYTILFDRYSLVATIGLTSPIDSGDEVTDICQRLAGLVTAGSRLPLVSTCQWNEQTSTLDIHFNQQALALENLLSGDLHIPYEDILLRTFTPPGHHHDAPPGVLILNGPMIRPGTIEPMPHIDDVFPTTAVLLGLPLAENLAGKPLLQVFDRKLPIKRIADYGERSESRPTSLVDGEPDKTDDWELERLRSLGYIE